MNCEIKTAPEPGMVPCPNSLERMNFLSSFELHYATPAELEAHGGVCKKCFKRFQRGNSPVLHGELEKPVEIPPVHRAPDVAMDHAAYDASSHLEQICDFDFGAVDEALAAITETPIDARQMAAEMFRRIAVWVWSGRNVSLQRATVRFAVITAGVMPDLIDDPTYSEIGKATGLTKAAVSKQALLFQDTFGIKFARSRSKEARENMAQSQMGHAPHRAGRSKNEKRVDGPLDPGVEP